MKSAGADSAPNPCKLHAPHTVSTDRLHTKEQIKLSRYACIISLAAVLLQLRVQHMHTLHLLTCRSYIMSLLKHRPCTVQASQLNAQPLLERVQVVLDDSAFEC
jgi:hypothetical protein